MNIKEVEKYRKQFNQLSFEIIKLLSHIWLDIYHTGNISVPTNVNFTNILQQVRNCLDQMEKDVNAATIQLPIEQKSDNDLPSIWE